MLPLPFNTPRFVMAAIGLSAAFRVGEWRHISAEGALMLVASAFLIPMDLIDRLTRKEMRLFHPSGGGNLFFVPIWIWGLLWSCLGASYTLHESERSRWIW